MKQLEDYYMILQVHHLAEPEVIEGAYKKLAKKYHPDVSRGKNSDEKMKVINQAYEELRDPVRRRQYDLRWKDKYSINPTIRNEHKEPQGKYEPAFIHSKVVLDEYFRNIMSNRFECSYRLVSNVDKHNISVDDFISWQRAVASVFHIRKYKCAAHRAHKNKSLNGHMFKEIAEFSVNMVEYNAVMDKEEKNSFVKAMVLEDGEWKVYIGCESLKPLIGRFKELTDLLAARSVMSELTEMYGRLDSLTGLLNRKGITEKVDSEIYRFNRYGHAFSLIMIQTDVIHAENMEAVREIRDHAVKAVSEILTLNLRKPDSIGRWSDMAFLILLPEAAAKDAAKVTVKLYHKLKNAKTIYKGKLFAITVKIDSAEYNFSFVETLNRLNRKTR